MYYKHYPLNDKGRLRAILIATEAHKLRLHNITISLVLHAEASFFIAWFDSQVSGFRQKGEIVFSEHMRAKADCIVQKLWNEIELQLKSMPEDKRIKHSINWGITLIDIRCKKLEYLEYFNFPEGNKSSMTIQLSN